MAVPRSNRLALLGAFFDGDHGVFLEHERGRVQLSEEFADLELGQGFLSGKVEDAGDGAGGRLGCWVGRGQ